MGGSTPKAGPSEKAMAEIAKKQQQRAELLQTTYEDPLRQQMQPMIQQALGTNPFQTSLSAAERQPIEGQFNQARSALMNTAQRGGGLRKAMTGLERDRAMAISSAANEAMQRGQARALQYGATGLPNVASISGLSSQGQQGAGSGASLESMRRQEGAAKQSSMLGTIGGLVGTGIGAYFGGPMGAAGGGAAGGAAGNAAGSAS